MNSEDSTVEDHNVNPSLEIVSSDASMPDDQILDPIQPGHLLPVQDNGVVKVENSKKQIMVGTISIIFILIVGLLIFYFINKPPVKIACNATSTYDLTGWKTYSNPNYGFEFKFPSDGYWISEYGPTVQVAKKNSNEQLMFSSVEVDPGTNPVDYARKYFGKLYISSETLSYNCTNWLVVSHKDGSIENIDRKIMYHLDGDRLYSISYAIEYGTLEKVATSLKLINKVAKIPEYPDMYYVVDKKNMNGEGRVIVSDGEVNVYLNDPSKKVSYYKVNIECENEKRNTQAFINSKEVDVCNKESIIASSASVLNVKFIDSKNSASVKSSIKIQPFRNGDYQIGGDFWSMLDVVPQEVFVKSESSFNSNSSSTDSLSDAMNSVIRYSPGDGFSVYIPKVWTIKQDASTRTLNLHNEAGKLVIKFVFKIQDDDLMGKFKNGDIYYLYEIKKDILNKYSYNTNREKMMSSAVVIKPDETMTYSLIPMFKINGGKSYLLPYGPVSSGGSGGVIDDFVKIEVVDSKYSTLLEPIVKTISFSEEMESHKDWLGVSLLDISRLLKEIQN